ncbi:MAG: hypothetical protein E6J06_05410 [Chloroflexi bacterium]|nr:MAG: hypothetical protein E6J06_05410 [Chloroflexota bacterium]
MRSPRLSPIVAGLVAMLALIAAPPSALAAPPSDLVPLGPSLPSCIAGAPDTPGAHICWVTPIRPGWQASTGEWVVVRLGDAEQVDPANPDAAKTLCEELQAAIVATITIDGQSLAVDTIPCELHPGSNGNPDVWFVDWRGLSQPLTPGQHTFTVSWYFTQTVPGFANAGDTSVFPTQTLTVIPQG